MSKLIRIGTTENTLAVERAEYIASLINPSNYTTEIVTVTETSEGLDAQLLHGKIDLTVCAAQDLPVILHDELEIIAFTERERVNDVLISRKKVTLTTTGIRVGTSSLRDAAFLKHLYPEAKALSLSSDDQANAKKMEAGECDALLMNYADANRLGYTNLIVEKIETSYFVPAVGQGSIAVVCHKKLSFDRKEIIQRWVNHKETEDCIRTERSFLKTFQGSSNIPTFGYAQVEAGLMTLKAGIISPDGGKVIKVKRSAMVAESKEMGKRVAIEVLEQEGALKSELLIL